MRGDRGCDAQFKATYCDSSPLSLEMEIARKGGDRLGESSEEVAEEVELDRQAGRLRADAFCSEAEEELENGVLLEARSWVPELSFSLSESSTSLSVS